MIPALLAERPRASLAIGACTSAALLALFGRAEAPFVALGFVALVPWLVALERAPSAKAAAASGLLVAALFSGLQFAWFPEAAGRYSASGPLVLWVIFFGASAAFQPQFVAAAVARHWALSRGRSTHGLAAAAFVCAYVGVEKVFPKLFSDTLGLALHPSAALRQGADVVGVHGLTALVLVVNELFAAALRPLFAAAPAEPSRRPAARPAIAAVALVGVAFAYGALRSHQVAASERGRFRVGLVQANVTNYDRMRAERGAFETVRLILDEHFARSRELVRAAPIDLLVWPETVYPTTFGSPKSESGAEFDAELRRFVRALDVPLVFGAYDVEGSDEYNAAFFLSPAQRETPRYRKTHLFPLTEWVPASIESDWLRRELPWAGRWSRGPGPIVVPVHARDGRSIRVAPLVCYDVLSAEFVAEAARDRPDVLVTLSNDSWFPDARAPRLHLISAAFRSIETRLPQVRATNSGLSAIVDATGEISRVTGWDRAENLAGDVVLVSAGRSPFLATAPALGPVLVAAAGLLAFGRRRSTLAPSTPQAQEKPKRRRLPQAKRRKRR